ncbi:MAG: C40 family peptidase [Bacteroidetes bacterium]|nr:C40 family peptidase [Bacteroidota bacterium]
MNRLCVLLFALLLVAACRHGRDGASSESAADKALKQKYAEKLQVPAASVTNLVLYRFVDDWYGVPYQYGGKTKAGVDCSGFSAALYQAVYKKTISGSAATLWSKCESVGEKNLQEGDLVFFKIGGDKVSHVGVYLQNRRFVHASTKKGVIISSLDEAYYTKYFFKGGRLK